MEIWVDADACPVKNEIERIGGKRGVSIVHVSAVELLGREAPGIRCVQVSEGPDAADEWILEHCSAGDILVTLDVPLSEAAIKQGVAVIEYRGRELTEENIGLRSQMRNLATSLREAGGEARGPAPFTPKDRRTFSSTFAQVLDRLLAQADRRPKL